MDISSPGAGSPPETKAHEKTTRDLLFQRNRILRDLIKRRHDLGIGLKTTLRHDEIGELGGNVHVRQLQRSSGERPQPAPPRNPHHTRACSQPLTVISIPIELKHIPITPLSQTYH